MPTTIEWADETWNPLVGCSRCSPGCDACYAIGVVHRGMSPQHVGLTTKREGERTDWTGEIRFVESALAKPLRWKRPRRVFVNSLSDLFHADVLDVWLCDILAVMALCPQHTFQVLTKRPQIMARRMADPAIEAEVRRRVDESLTLGEMPWPLPNLWLGTSIESDRYTFRADHLRGTPAALRFLSLEPLLGPLPSLDLTGIDWCIVGGESGPGARPMHPEWVRDIRDRCVDAGVPFLFKQWGEWAPWVDHFGRKTCSLNADGSTEFRSNSVTMGKVGKKAAGRVLDGRTWDQFPAPVEV